MRTRALVLLFIPLLSGCGERKYVKDTEGRPLVYASGVVGMNDPKIHARPTGPAPHPTDFAGWGSHATGRYLGVCDAWYDRAVTHVTGLGGLETCRAVTCAKDDDCPHVDKQAFACTGGLCSNAAAPLQLADVMMLCLAGSGAWSGTPAQLAQKASAEAACASGTCTAPPACHAP